MHFYTFLWTVLVHMLRNFKCSKSRKAKMKLSSFAVMRGCSASYTPLFYYSQSVNGVRWRKDFQYFPFFTLLLQYLKPKLWIFKVTGHCDDCEYYFLQIDFDTDYFCLTVKFLQHIYVVNFSLHNNLKSIRVSPETEIIWFWKLSVLPDWLLIFGLMNGSIV